jgi:hypothetical protein
VTRRTVEVASVAAIVVVAAWLRLVHLGTPSLWWDELVELRTADRPLADVLREVRLGVGPSSGNAGAMPGDYVLLHAYLRTTTPPAPERLEAYFRAPSCAYSIAAVLALHLLGRMLFGRAVGWLAALLLATSLPAVLYAAEVRPYSLLSLLTVLQFVAFATVVRAPWRATAWLAQLATSCLYFLTGLFGLFVVAAELAVLGWLAFLRRATGPSIAVVLGSAAALALVVGGYLAGTAVGATYPRHVDVEPLAITWRALVFLAADAPAVAVAFLVAAPLAVRAGIRRGCGPVAVALVASFLALPSIALVIKWKHYYFHGRHVLFLLPLFHLVLAAGVLELVRIVDVFRRTADPRGRRLAETLVVGAVAVTLVLAPLRAFLAAPDWFFARTKTLHDVRPVVQAVAARVATLGPDAPYLLVAERDSPANAVLTAYLEWYRIADRITLRSPGVAVDQVEPILRSSGGDPTGLRLRPAVGLFFGFKRLLRLERPVGEIPARVGAFGVVGYATPLPGPGVRRWANVTFREPAAIAPSPPRS